MRTIQDLNNNFWLFSGPDQERIIDITQYERKNTGTPIVPVFSFLAASLEWLFLTNTYTTLLLRQRPEK
ncbi:MAG: hypothetical protein J5589_06660 [Firmicutes bacterium]|nr:hypothetical protein [Bacillota bacterium]